MMFPVLRVASQDDLSVSETPEVPFFLIPLFYQSNI